MRPTLNPRPLTPSTGHPNFAPPVVELYDDIADIITMDPIHDVDTG